MQPVYLSRSVHGVVETGIPSRRRGEPNLWPHEVYGGFEDLLTPLATDGQAVDMRFILNLFLRRLSQVGAVSA